MTRTPRSLKTAVRATALRALGVPLRHLPLQRWPARCADLFDIKLPGNVRRKPDISPTGGANINIILHLLDQTRAVPGDLAECGVFRGATLIPTALYLRQHRLKKRVFGFDSFQGFDQSIDIDLRLGGAEDSEKRAGGFASTSQQYVAGRLAALGLAAHATLIPGYFERTLPTATARQYSFVHLDCDIYSSYRQCLAYFYPRMAAGGVILFDEYNDPPWPGCNKAIDEFLAEHPETLHRIERDGYEKYFIVKTGVAARGAAS